MRLTDIAAQNLRRRKTRSLLLMLSIVLGVASLVFLYATTQAMKEDVANKIDEFGSNILITPDNSEAMTFGGVTVEATAQVQELDMSIVPRMHTIKNKETLAIVSPKLLADAEIKGKQVLLLGVQFEQELKIKKWWNIEGWDKRKAPGPNQILVGSDAARVLGLGPNQTVEIRGQEFRVAGVILPTGSTENDQTVFLDLAALQKLTNQPNAISLVEASAWCYTCPIDQVTQQLREKLPGMKVTALRSTIQSRDNTVQKFNIFALAVSLILLFASGLVVTMTMISSVKERTREIGILRAIGFRKGHIAQIILSEAAILSIFGGLIGYVLGMSVAVKFGSGLAKVQVAIPWQWLLAAYSLAGAVIVALLASAYPAWKATKLDPAESLRYI